MDIGLDQVGEAILLAREMTEQVSSAEAQFNGLLEGLDEDERADLVALVWIGRGDFEPEEWDEARRTAMEQATTPTADYLRGTDHLADHLEAGLEAMGLSPSDAEDSAVAG
jgi:hypothetical protein